MQVTILTKLWVGIKVCISPSVRLSIHPFIHLQPKILCAQLLLHPLMDFVHNDT